MSIEGVLARLEGEVFMPIDSLPGLAPFALTTTLLMLLLLVLWHLSGVQRATTKTTPNPEDTKTFGSALTPVDPEGVARALRIHRNAAANIGPFVVLGALLVLLGASSSFMSIVGGVFVTARSLHAVAYARAIQPFRTMAHGVGLLTTLLVAEEVGRALLTRL